MGTGIHNAKVEGIKEGGELPRLCNFIAESAIRFLSKLSCRWRRSYRAAHHVTLAATLATIPTIPVAGIALILGVDRFMSEARALTNLVGNSVATIVVAKWEGALDMQRLHAELDQPTVIEEEPFLPDDGLLQPVPADK